MSSSASSPIALGRPSAGSAARGAGDPRARYRPLYGIGRGGMGRVEVALERGQEGFERIVALKWLLPDAARDRRHTEMFLREARLAALLHHPNVVHAFDSGEIDGEFFMAMEYVEGEPLSLVIRRARERERGLAPPLVAHVLIALCEGLHAAHELTDEHGKKLNVVHRDVSPHNVMLAYDGQVKLLDFGVAKIAAEHGLTKTGEVKGKVAYMSPEQAMGDALDRTSDLYSLGAVLFECLSGRKTWDGTDMEVLRHLALDEPPSLEDAAPGAPMELCDLYTQLVARAPSDRPPTALHVAERLRGYLARSGTQPDARVLGAVMGRLFGEEAAERRRALTEALNDVAPSSAADLRRGLDSAPRALAESLAPPGRSYASRAPLPSSAPARRLPWALIVGSTALAAGMAAGAFAVHRAPSADTGAAEASASPREPTPSTADQPAISAVTAPTASSVPSAIPRVPASIEAPAPRSTRAGSAPPSRPAVTPKPRASSKPVDVDPDPI